MSDVTLNGDHVAIDGQLRVYGPDVHLSEDARRDIENRSTFRRALVHDHRDTLVVNFNNDYKGVTINGNKTEGIECRGKVHVDGQLHCSSSFQCSTMDCKDIVETSRITVTHHLGVSDNAHIYIGGQATFRTEPTVPDLMVLGLGKKIPLGSGAQSEFGQIGQIGQIGHIEAQFPVAASLVDTIKTLQATIADLEARLTALET